MMRKVPVFLLLIYCTGFLARLSGQSPAPEDYRRAISMMTESLINKKVFNLTLRPELLPDSSGFWWLNTKPGGHTFEKLIFKPLKRERAFDHEKVADLLSNSLKIAVRPDSLPFSSIRFIGPDTISLRIKDQNWLLNTKKYTLILSKPERRSPRQQEKSPDGKWTAFSRNFNLFIKSEETGEEFQLSIGGRKNYEYASYYGWVDIMEGEGGKRPEKFAVSWSPDSRWLQTSICDLRSARKMYLLDWSVDSLYRPRLLSYYRGSPGDTGMIYMIPVLFDVAKRTEIRMLVPRNTHINNIDFTWTKDNRLFGSYWERGFKAFHLIEIDKGKGESKDLYTERSETNVDNYAFSLRFLNSCNKALITSERSGWNQLYLIDLNTGKFTPVTTGDYFFREILQVNEGDEKIWFTASGKEEGRNPYFRFVYSVKFDGSGLKLLTTEDANHDAVFFKGCDYFVDNFSTISDPTVSVLRNIYDGAIIEELSHAVADDLLATGWQFPEVFTATARDGKTTIYGALWKPSGFDPSRKYPVIDNSYTGPHTNVFPESFPKAVSGTNLSLAELGFVVVRIDGMGSAGRSKEFHNWSYKNLGMGLADHVLAIRELGKKYNWIDTTRVGIFGHSAGGYDAAHALLQFPDFFKVGVSTSADHDHRMEKAWWPEMYMGWPVDSAYHLQSNITMAPNLKGKLLIAHGGVDSNVNPSATFKLAEAFIKAGKEFDMIILPSQDHGYREPHRWYMTKKTWNYFVENLLDGIPLWEISSEK